MKQYAAYLFDLDGTLIDTAELIYRCFLHTCRKFGNFEIERDRVIAHIGLPLRDQYIAYFGELSEKQMQEYSAEHMRYQVSIYYDHLRVFPGVVEGLEKIKARGRPLVIVTSRRQESCRLFLEKTGLANFFEFLVTPESTVRHKPHPEPILYALKQLGIAASDALMIGDATFDIQCGTAAGTDTAFVSWSYNTAADLIPQPTYIINDLLELCDIKSTKDAL